MEADIDTIVWHFGMICVSFFNCLWWCFLYFTRETDSAYLSFIYTLVCAYRSIFPRVDLERNVLIDKSVSSIFLGRTCSTIAEIAFAIQVSNFFSCNIVYIIILAQMFCWLSVLTLNPLWHIIEESFWMVSACYIGISNITNLPYTTLYVAYMIIEDIPMYIQKYREWDGRYLHITEGLRNSIHVRNRKVSWNYWKDEATWMSLYFSVGVLFSNYMMIK